MATTYPEAVAYPESVIVEDWKTLDGVRDIITNPKYANGYFTVEFVDVSRGGNRVRAYETGRWAMSRILNEKEKHNLNNDSFLVRFTPYSSLSRKGVKVCKPADKGYKGYFYYDKNGNVLFKDVTKTGFRKQDLVDLPDGGYMITRMDRVIMMEKREDAHYRVESTDFRFLSKQDLSRL